MKAASKATAQGPPVRGSTAKRTAHISSTVGSKEDSNFGKGRPKDEIEFSVPTGSLNLLIAAITKMTANKQPAQAPT